MASGVINGYYKVLDPTDYITINSGITVNAWSLIQIAKHIALLNIDFRATLNAGETAIGQVKNTIKLTSYLAGRSSTSSGTYPATGVVIPTGQLRIHVTANSVAGVLNGVVVI